MVDWDEYEAVVGTSSLLTTRRSILAREKAAMEALAREKACEELALILADQAREALKTPVEPIRKKRKLK